MSDSRLAAIRREFMENLCALSVLAGPRSSRLDAEKISRGKSEGNAPRGGHATMDEALERYEKVNLWVEDKRRIAVFTGSEISHDEYVQQRVLHLLNGAPDHELDFYDDANREVAKLVAREKRRQAPLELTPKQRNHWIVWSTEGKRPHEVAAEYGVAESTVREIRKGAGKEMERGKPHKGFGGRPRKQVA